MSGLALSAPEPIEGFQIKGVEIFRVGEWNGDEYDTSDLDAMIAAFPKQGFGVPIIFGHDPQPGSPAQGWVSNLYRDGDVLKADFKDLNWSVYCQIIDHAYDHVSCEIYWNLKRDGATYTRALKAVALLGAETPAVSGLQPLRNAQFSEPKFTSDQFEKVACASLQVVSRQMAAQDNSELEKKFAALSDTVAALTKANDDLKKSAEADKVAAAAEVKAAHDKIAALTAEKVKNDIASFEAKCKVPAISKQIGQLYAFALSEPTRLAKFTDKEGKAVEKPYTEVLDEIVGWANQLVANRTTQLSLVNQSRVENGNVAEYDDASAELAKRVNSYMAKNGLKGTDGFTKATQAELAADPQLAAAYQAQRSGKAA